MPSPTPRLLSCLHEALDLVLPAECPGCGAGGARWCRACATHLGELRVGGWPRVVSPAPRPPDFPTCWSAVPYTGVAQRVLTAYKDGDRPDLIRVLSPLVAAATAAARDDLGPDPDTVLVVPVPSSSASVRRRGRRPTRELAGVSGRVLGGRAVVAEVLVPTRRTRDQAGLGAAERAANLTGSMRLHRGVVLAGAACLVVDDVTTSGATLAEAARVLSGAGAGRVLAVTAAATQRRLPLAGPHRAG